MNTCNDGSEKTAETPQSENENIVDTAIPQTETPDSNSENKETETDQQAESSDKPDANNVSTWVKPKMTTSLSNDMQAEIRALAPRNVVNITQFIRWILSENFRLGNENKAYNQNQENLNQVIKARQNEIDELTAKIEEVPVKKTIPQKADAKPTPAKPMTFAQMLGIQ